MARSLGVADLLRESASKAKEDYVNAFAAGLAYQGLFATFLLLLFLLSLLGVFHATDLVNQLVNRVSLWMPAEVSKLLNDQINELETQRANNAFTVGAILSVLAALWGISGAFRYAMQALNIMYKVEERRPPWKLHLTALALSLVVAVLMITAAVLVVFGPSIGGRVAEAIGVGAVFRWTWNILQWPLLVNLVLLAFALVYYYAPDVKQKFRYITPGSLIGVLLWLMFSLLFLVFVNTFGGYHRVYGALAGVAIHMLYMYGFSYILLFGAEINQVVEAHTAGGKKPGERVPREDLPPHRRRRPWHAYRRSS